VTGACLCGAVRFEVSGPLRDVVVCHCSLCRRSGTSAAAYTSAPRGAVHLLADEGLATYVDVNGRERGFCRACGSSLFWAEPGAGSISISAGALDGETGLRVERHIHGASAADWERLPADLPVHREGSSSPVVTPSGE
jgi:hypothetical protein